VFNHKYRCESCKDTKKILLLNHYVPCKDCVNIDNEISLDEIADNTNAGSGSIIEIPWPYCV